MSPPSGQYNVMPVGFFFPFTFTFTTTFTLKSLYIKVNNKTNVKNNVFEVFAGFYSQEIDNKKNLDSPSAIIKLGYDLFFSQNPRFYS